MKRALILVAAFALALSAQAQQASTQPVKPNAADLAVAFTVGWVTSFAAVVTGNVPALCKRLRGTYDPTGYDQCPNGQWRYLFSPQ
jgi:hypothetical protein